MIPVYLLDPTVWWSLLPIPALVLIVAAVAYGLLRRAQPPAGALLTLLPPAAFLLLGLVAGYLTGLSRESAVGAVVPAVLSLMGAVAAVLIGKTDNPRSSGRVSALMLLLSLGLLVGTTWGSAMRQAVMDFEASESELIRKSHVELKVREFREAIGLPPEMPAEASPPPKKKGKD